MHDLSIRETHGYVGTYAYLDKWQSIGGFDILWQRTRERTEEQANDMCEPLTQDVLCYVSAEDGTTPEQIKQALHDHFTSQGCAHEWDCCGCRSYSASSVTHVRATLWRVVINSSRNY